MLKGVALCALIFGCVISQSALAEDNGKPAPGASDEADSRWRGAFSFGFSRPLVTSLMLGAMLPLGHQDPQDPLPGSPALRMDVELGLGGGSVDGGLFIPFTADGLGWSFSLKAERMRTWLWSLDVPRDRVFNGGVVELALPSMHGGPKLGVGSFHEISPVGGVGHSFTYVFLGMGW